MGYANPKGRCHVGPKKKTRSRKFHKPICDEVKQTSGLNPMDEATIKVLSQMDDTAWVSSSWLPHIRIRGCGHHQGEWPCQASRA